MAGDSLVRALCHQQQRQQVALLHHRMTRQHSELPRTRMEAEATGSKRYFTGEPCKNGHVGERYASCGACVVCAIARAAARQIADPGAKSAYDRNRYLTNPLARVGAGAWAKNNPDKANEARRRWKVENPEKHKESQTAWALRNPEKVQSNVRARRARKRNAEGRHTEKDITDLLSRQKYKCAECGTSVRKRSSRQVDHIMPLKLGGSNWPSNLQVLCCTCNKVKAAKHPIDFALERGRLF